MNPFRGSVALGVFFGLFWCGITGTFDFFVGRTIVRQLRAKSYATTAGRITRSAVTRKSGGKSTTWGVDIQYTYEVAGKQYGASRYRYDEMTSSDRTWAQVAVRANPAGATRTVYYNPRDPSDAVLSVGLQGSDLFLPMFLMPFNAIGLGLVLWPFLALKRWLTRSELPGHRVMRTGMRTTVRLPRFAPVTAALATLGISAFVMMFGVAFTGSGFHPSFGKALAAWAIVLTLTVGAFAWRWLRVASGAEDLVIDPGAAAVSLPMTFGRKRRVLVPVADICGVTVRQEFTRGRRGTTSTHYAPTILGRAGAELAEAKLAHYGDEASAERLAAWVRIQLGLKESNEA